MKLPRWITNILPTKRDFGWKDLTLQQYEHILAIQRIYGHQPGEDQQVTDALMAVRMLSVLTGKSFDELRRRHTPYELGQLAARHTRFLSQMPDIRQVSAFRLGSSLFSIPASYDTVPLYQWVQIESQILKKKNDPDNPGDLALFLAVACIQPVAEFKTERIEELKARFRNVKLMTALGMRAFFLRALRNSKRSSLHYLTQDTEPARSTSTPRGSVGRRLLGILPRWARMGSG